MIKHDQRRSNVPEKVASPCSSTARHSSSSVQLVSGACRFIVRAGEERGAREVLASPRRRRALAQTSRAVPDAESSRGPAGGLGSRKPSLPKRQSHLGMFPETQIRCGASTSPLPLFVVGSQVQVAIARNDPVLIYSLEFWYRADSTHA
jgi:hypothetical protein